MRLEPHWHNRLYIDGQWRSWEELRDECHFDADLPTAVVVQHHAQAFAALALAASADAELLLVAEERFDDDLAKRLSDNGFSVLHHGVVIEPRHQRSKSPGRVTVLTSGTTGEPKFVTHTLDTLATLAGRSLAPATWLFPYSPGTYAWFQAATLGLSVADQHLVPVDPRDPADWVATAEQAGADHITATPTFWRRALLFSDREALRRLPLRQITLGGEAVQQDLLDALHALYPDARLTHVYASSELGATFSVSDGRAGFPKEWLGLERQNGVLLQVIDGRLHVRSPGASPDVGFVLRDTGDAVEVTDDRVIVVGREDERFLNVAGTKVDATSVRDVVMQHPSVAWADVRGRKSAITGTLVVADVVAAEGHTIAGDDVVRWCVERLPEAAVPRLVKVLTDIPISATGKTERKR